LVRPEVLAAEIAANPMITGLTFSGGEPMAQAAGLAEVARSARRLRDLSVVCFTGYRLENLRRRPPSVGVAELLDEVDVLIDGQYVAARNDNRGLRGSSNQRIHHLTERLVGEGYDFATRQRTAEIRVAADGLVLVGVPTLPLLSAFDWLADRLSDHPTTAAPESSRPDHIVPEVSCERQEKNSR
jgi:anaerobic ribonucleoside-triphosphate reductase activating protein